MRFWIDLEYKPTTMEKETKTAEEKIIDDLFGKHLHPDSQSCCGITFDHVAAMKEYGQMCAEQARREERKRHSELISYLKEFMGSSLHFNRSTFKELLAAAGYEGKEEA